MVISCDIDLLYWFLEMVTDTFPAFGPWGGGGGNLALIARICKLTKNADSNHARGMDICLLSGLSVSSQSSLRQTVRACFVCVCFIKCDHTHQW